METTGVGRGAGARPARVGVLVAAAVVALAVVLALVLSGNGHDRDVGWGSGAGGRFSAGDADVVVLDGVSGRVRVGSGEDARGITGTFHRADGAPARVRAAAGDDRTVTVTCPDDAGHVLPCSGDLTLTLPPHTGLRLRQTSGETVLTGLGGELDLATTSDRLTATGLRPARAGVRVTSGSADLGFAAAPADLAVRATSASAAVRLPDPPDGAYAVTTAATSADVRVQVPHTQADPRARTPHRLSLAVVSSSVAVLPA